MSAGWSAKILRFETTNTTKGDTKMKAAMFVITALILVSTLAGGAATGTINICQRTADAVERSCQAAAQSDYQLALAKCENITNPAERKACQDQAASDLKEALQTCEDRKSVV